MVVDQFLDKSCIINFLYLLYYCLVCMLTPNKFISYIHTTVTNKIIHAIQIVLH